jgi:quinol monooxygenase YgiN
LANLIFVFPIHQAEIRLNVCSPESKVAFYITARKDDPNTFVFYEIYRSQAALDFHLQQDFTKKFVATLKSAQLGDRVQTNLVELAPEEQTYPN